MARTSRSDGNGAAHKEGESLFGDGNAGRVLRLHTGSGRRKQRLDHEETMGGPVKNPFASLFPDPYA